MFLRKSREFDDGSVGDCWRVVGVSYVKVGASPPKSRVDLLLFKDDIKSVPMANSGAQKNFFVDLSETLISDLSLTPTDTAWEAIQKAVTVRLHNMAVLEQSKPSDDFSKNQELAWFHDSLEVL